MSNKISTQFIILSICIIFSSCAINMKVPIKRLDASIVPTDFNPNKHVLLITQIQKRYKPSQKDEKRTKNMESNLVKYYPYKYEIVSLQDVQAENSRYSDTSIYKYALVTSVTGVQHSSSTTVATSNGGMHTLSPSATTTYIYYRFLDRFNSKYYEPSYASPWIKTSVEAFANTVKKAKT